MYYSWYTYMYTCEGEWSSTMLVTVTIASVHVCYVYMYHVHVLQCRSLDLQKLVSR